MPRQSAHYSVGFSFFTSILEVVEQNLTDKVTQAPMFLVRQLLELVFDLLGEPDTDNLTFSLVFHGFVP